MGTVLKGTRPDITPAQIISGIPIFATLLRAFGVYDLAPDQQNALSDATTWAMALIAGDAILRVGRNYAAAKTAFVGQPVPPQGDEIVDDEVVDLHPSDAGDVPPEMDLPPEALGKPTAVEPYSKPPLLPGEDVSVIGLNADDPPLRPAA